MAQAGKDMGNAAASFAAAAQQRRSLKQAELGVVARVTYCEQNLDGFVTADEGVRKGCGEEVGTVKATCTIGKDKRHKNICKMLAMPWKPDRSSVK